MFSTNGEKTYYLNPKIKRAELKEEYTTEQIIEYNRCASDPIYFIENYVEINSLDKGYVKFKVRGYQKDLIEKYHKHNKNIVLSSRQSGKCLSINSNIRLRNKNTGEIIEITIGKFYEQCKKELSRM
jgi:hypothetical protein